MNDAESATFAIGRFTLDLQRGRLFGPKGEVVLRPKSFLLLSHLARQAGRVVPKDELMGALWPDVTVTEESLTQCVRDVRRALTDEGAQLLRTLPRRGYLLEARQGRPAEVRAEAPAAVPLRPDGIAVLPFRVTSGLMAEAHLFDGLAHDLISRLARLRSFHVIARGSTFALRHLDGDPCAAGRALGVGHVVAGTTEARGAEVVLRVELVRVADGAILWTEDLVTARSEVQSLIDRMAERIAQNVQMQVTMAETRRALALPLSSLDAWGAYHAGLHDCFRFDTGSMSRALARLDQATRLDPGFARAHAATSFCHYFLAFSGSGADSAVEIAAARHSAEAAMLADEGNPSSHWAYGRVLWLEGDAEGCMQHSRRAVEISPGYAQAQYMVGFLEAHVGDATRAVAQMDLVLSLSPFDPFLSSVQITRAIAMVRLGEVEGAADWARDAARQPTAYPTLLAPAALILAEAGRVEEARQVRGMIRQQAPTYGIDDLSRSLRRTSPEMAALMRRNASIIGL